MSIISTPEIISTQETLENSCGHMEYDGACSPTTCGRFTTDTAFMAAIQSARNTTESEFARHLANGLADVIDDDEFNDFNDFDENGWCNCGCEGDELDHEIWREIRYELGGMYSYYSANPPPNSEVSFLDDYDEEEEEREEEDYDY